MSPRETLEELAAFVAWAGLIWTVPWNIAAFMIDVLRIWLGGADGLVCFYLVLVLPVIYIAAVASIIAVRRHPWVCLSAVGQAVVTYFWIGGMP